MRGKERKGEDRREKERKGEERRGKERRGKERKGEDRRGEERRGPILVHPSALLVNWSMTIGSKWRVEPLSEASIPNP